MRQCYHFQMKHSMKGKMNRDLEVLNSFSLIINFNRQIFVTPLLRASWMLEGVEAKNKQRKQNDEENRLEVDEIRHREMQQHLTGHVRLSRRIAAAVVNDIFLS